MPSPHSQFYDLSHVITDGLITYKGLPAPVICDYWSREASSANYDDGSSFHIAKIELVSNTGTYLDCPFHRYEDGDDLSRLELEKLADLDTIIIEADYKKFGMQVDTSFFENKDLKGKAVLINTNWSRHWNTETYYSQHPYITEDAALLLKENGAILVGMDTYNVDNTSLSRRPVHSILLGADILIVEHLCNLETLPRNKQLAFTAVPPKISGVGTFAVRAFAKEITR